MTRSVGFVCATLLVLGPASVSRAQTDAPGRYETERGDFGMYSDDDEPYGGFGMDYMETVPSGALMMDRFGMVYRAPVVRTQADPGPRRAFGTVRSESRPRSSRPRVRRMPTRTQPTYPLPTGSLDWPAGRAVLLYSPALRYRSYGSGAARSPYGSIEYGTMYHGWPLSY